MTQEAPRALAHPLPAGMRDLLPEEARARRALAAKVLDHVALAGYELVITPAFELAEVLERGLGVLEAEDVLRFVEPGSGEVAALRPDMTPQIARIVATRLARAPWPIRLSYEGTVVRRRQGRARRHRQVAQAGVELCGAPGLAGDLEVLELCASVARVLGLEHAAIDLGHAAIPRALLAPLPRALVAEVSDALGQKDGARVERLLARHPDARLLAALSDLHGGGPGDASGQTILDRGRALLEGSPAAPALAELARLWHATEERALGPMMRLDLGASRGFAYYTGPTFQVLARGPGEPIGAGGRYDDLLARFDAPMPAVGFALNLDSVAWARQEAGVVDGARPRLVVAGGGELVAELRARGVVAVACTREEAGAYAAASRFSHVIEVEGDRARVSAVTGGLVVTVEARDVDELVRVVERA